MLLQPASEQELLQYVVGDYDLEDQAELERKVGSKRRNYARYYSYIENEINVDQVANIRQYWITNILDLIPAEFENLEKDYVEQMIDDMLNEVNQDYYDSIRKAILDYVLRDPEERSRIGITETYEAAVDYGAPASKHILADKQWQACTANAREFIKNNLVICNKATLKMMSIWAQYEEKHFVSLPEKKEQPMPIQIFVLLQEERINEVKATLENEWIKELMDIYQEELATMGKNKRQAIIFFEANATLMSNQLRKLIEESLLMYKAFFDRFSKPDVLTPMEVIMNEKSPE